MGKKISVVVEGLDADDNYVVERVEWISVGFWARLWRRLRPRRYSIITGFTVVSEKHSNS